MPRRLEYDWFPGTISDNIVLGPCAYLDSAFGFASFFSERDPGMRIGRATGLYDRATIISGPQATIDVGEFVCLNGTYLICNREITIGSHALLFLGLRRLRYFAGHQRDHRRSSPNSRSCVSRSATNSSASLPTSPSSHRRECLGRL